jgi:hypothetical protein
MVGSYGCRARVGAKFGESFGVGLRRIALLATADRGRVERGELIADPGLLKIARVLVGRRVGVFSPPSCTS